MEDLDIKSIKMKISGMYHFVLKVVDTFEFNFQKGIHF